MKRILALILCGVLCLGLCACGGSGGSSRGEHDRLLAMLDEHDYQGAVNYINNLAYDYAQENKGDADTQQYVYTAALTGEWVAYNVEEGVTVPKVEFKEDGTCTIGENEYLWEVMSEGKTNLSINILNGAEQVHSFSLGKNVDNGNITGNSSNIVKDKYINFYNPAHYEVVEITLDNFEDYFAEKAYYSFGANDFGETNSIYANRCWILKEDLYARLWTSQSDVAVEYTYNMGNQYANWDLNAKTCTLTDRYEYTGNKDNPKTYTQTHKLSNYDNSSTEKKDDYYYGYRFMYCNGYTNSEGESYFSGYHTNTKLTRVQGSLWLVKEDIKNLQKTDEE